MSEQDAPISEEERAAPVQQGARQHGMPGLTWAIILITVGVVFLLNNLHIAGFSINWVELIRFWPVALILLGLDIMIGRRSVFGSLAVATISLVVIGGLIWMVGFTDRQFSSFGPSVTREVSQPFGDVETARVNLNLGAGETRVEPMSDSKNLVDGTYTTNRNLDIKVDYKPDGDTGILTIRQEDTNKNVDMFGDFIGRLDLKLTDAIPVDVKIDAGVGSVTLDLTGIKLSSLTIKGGVGAVEVTLPDKGEYAVSADMGIGALVVRVPKSLGAAVSYDGGISNINVPSRFNEDGENHWRTSGYDGAKDKVKLDVKAGIGNIDVIDG